MIALWIAAQAAAVAQAQPPRLRNGAVIVTAKDYPKDELPYGDAGITSVLVHVTPDGRARDCAVTETSGTAALDSHTCFLVTSIARFDPATDATARATEGTYRFAAAWGLGEPDMQPRLSLNLAIAALPSDYRQALKARVVFGADGRAVTCQTIRSSGDATIDAGLCGNIIRNVMIAPPKSASAEPGAAVRNVTFGLRPAKGPAAH